jgi:hypothetical protein
MLNWLLIFVPVAVALEFLKPESHALIFLAACFAIVPLAGWLGRATEQLAHHTGESVGALLNRPPSSVVALRFAPLSELVIVTLAPGTAPPLGSPTDPMIALVVSPCARSLPTRLTSRNAKTAANLAKER